ncbi:AbrB/MazE/SpoVT family DNA-binding domain-containing protein [Sandaracinomonas limnophila]|uniref:AbrB/MazE/SpoVT family DNA-binding domain-containing protein n=1 Tax=Sandaracinomonas limnophila TaxID=1862386 RepID=A0A437PQZ8_9BACT|nr:AbrB/MazE/SpoVT family DNA-binding domain-containing protein [Sandaracinomonas limnophila]RVU24683.1 AbrB/MazE/SpoVT family DNA-binding domain-containing protein [Sandaracinomonas limnophila]
MEVQIISIGNSKGIRLPKTILEKYNLDDKLELEMKDDCIVLKPLKTPRLGWDEAFKKMNAQKDDELLIPDVFEDEEFE